MALELGKPAAEIDHRLIADFVSNLADQYDEGFHILYTKQTIRNLSLQYSAAVSAMLLKIYGRKWRGALALYMLDEPKHHPVVKALFKATEA